mmetsp:Transcript_11726/g.25361  ORF Transcript_11726/g.25361 Transcript_11726/m.25361 type:complete len:502 (-) Transcript_11726:120-1625(-)
MTTSGSTGQRSSKERARKKATRRSQDLWQSHKQTKYPHEEKPPHHNIIEPFPVYSTTPQRDIIRMVSTRAMKAMASFAEEKKDDDGDYSIVANPPRSADEAQDPIKPQSIESDVPSAPATKKSPLLLLLCASGITSCYLWYGTVQEHIFHMDNSEEGEGDNESITLFLLATGTFSAFLVAWMWSVMGPVLLPQKSGSGDGSKRDNQALVGRLNHPLIVLTSLAYLSAMSASNESLHYVSYPTCVLAKSAKLIPTMVVGWLVDRWRRRRSGGGGTGKSIDATEWIGAVLITVGIVSFQYIQLRKQSNGSHHGGEKVEGDSPYGLALLGLSLFMDGLLGACQSVLKQKDSTSETTTAKKSTYRPPSPMETMLYINLYATSFLIAASHYAGQLRRGIDIMRSNSSSKSMLLLQLNLSASLGQVFIFLTIHHFSPLTCTTVTTTRKFFTILLSVYKFGHVLDGRQWTSIGLVFGGLYLQIAAKLFERHREEVGGGEPGAGKKKVE